MAVKNDAGYVAGKEREYLYAVLKQANGHIVIKCA